MFTVRSLVVVAAALPMVLAAQQAPARAPRAHRFSVAWLAPRLAEVDAQTSAAMASLPSVMAAARIGLAQAHAALAATDLQMRDVRSVSAFSVGGDFEHTPPNGWALQDPANGQYSDARSALNRGRYADAAMLFADVYTRYPKSAYAANAYYWQAYALSRRGGSASLQKALEVLILQHERAPNATTRRDADALATRIRGELARGGDSESAAVIAELAGSAARAPIPPVPPTATTPTVAPMPAIAGTRSSRFSRGNQERCENEDDTQSAALSALLQMDAERATPILKKVLARRDEGSLCLRRKAVFMVSQHEGPETERILLDAARNDPDSDVRGNAVFWLSQVDSPGAIVALDSILRSSSDPVLQDKALFAVSQHESTKARQILRDFALRAGVSDDLREKAIFWIGQGDDPENFTFLKTLYTQLKVDNLKDKVLFSVSQVEGKESQRWLLAVAGDANESIELRKKALFWVGQSDLPVADLFSIYDRMANRDMKEHMIFVISQRDEKAAVDKMIQIAKTETDRELKKKAIFWLSQSDDPRVAEFLSSLLEKP